MKMALAVSSFFSSVTPFARLHILYESLEYLKNSNFPGPIFIVDDRSEDVVEYPDFNQEIVIIKRKENGGYSKCKNTGLKHCMNSGADIIFLADDDMRFKEGFWEPYVKAFKESEIQHLSFCERLTGNHLMENPRGFEEKPYRRQALLNGCFLAFTRKCIETVGYMPNVPFKYGHEHTVYMVSAIAKRMAPFYADAIGSENYLSIIPESQGIQALTPEQHWLEENGKWVGREEYFPLVE